MKKELEDTKEKMLRAYAEMENVRQRAKRDIDTSRQFAIQVRGCHHEPTWKVVLSEVDAQDTASTVHCRLWQERQTDYGLSSDRYPK